MRCGRLAIVGLMLLRCTDHELQRMVNQPKYLPYAENDFFDDHLAMRYPPVGVVSREGVLREAVPREAVPDGSIEDTFVDKIPVPITKDLLQRGRKRFEIVCAACHGLLGDGDSVVATKMSLVAPPSLFNSASRPDGYFYAVITEGYGLMPSYASVVPAQDRWGVVAYFRALQRSRSAPLSAAPPAVQASLLKERK